MDQTWSESVGISIEELGSFSAFLDRSILTHENLIQPSYDASGTLNIVDVEDAASSWRQCRRFQRATEYLVNLIRNEDYQKCCEEAVSQMQSGDFHGALQVCRQAETIHCVVSADKEGEKDTQKGVARALKMAVVRSMFAESYRRIGDGALANKASGECVRYLRKAEALASVDILRMAKRVLNSSTDGLGDHATLSDDDDDDDDDDEKTNINTVRGVADGRGDGAWKKRWCEAVLWAGLACRTQHSMVLFALGKYVAASACAAEAVLCADGVTNCESRRHKCVDEDSDYSNLDNSLRSARLERVLARLWLGVCVGDGMGRVRDACTVLREASTLAEDLKEDPTVRASVSLRLGGVLRRVGDTFSARSEYNSCLEAIERLGALDYVQELPDAMKAILKLQAAALTRAYGDALKEEGSYEEALLRYEDAFFQAEMAAGLDDKATPPASAVEPLWSMADIHASHGDPGAALEAYARAKTILVRRMGADHPALAATALRVGNAYLTAGNPQAAAKLFAKVAQAAFMQTFHFKLDDVAGANACMVSGHFRLALKIYSHMATASLRALGMPDVRTAGLLASVGNALQLCGKMKAAATMYDRARQCIENAAQSASRARRATATSASDTDDAEADECSGTELLAKEGHLYRLATLYSNIAAVFSMQGKLKEAFHYYSLSRHVCVRHGPPPPYSRVFASVSVGPFVEPLPSFFWLSARSGTSLGYVKLQSDMYIRNRPRAVTHTTNHGRTATSLAPAASKGSIRSNTNDPVASRGGSGAF
eukprot:Rmarinus@m.9156